MDYTDVDFSNFTATPHGSAAAPNDKNLFIIKDANEWI